MIACQGEQNRNGRPRAGALKEIVMANDMSLFILIKLCIGAKHLVHQSTSPSFLLPSPLVLSLERAAELELIFNLPKNHHGCTIR